MSRSHVLIALTLAVAFSVGLVYGSNDTGVAHALSVDWTTTGCDIFTETNEAEHPDWIAIREDVPNINGSTFKQWSDEWGQCTRGGNCNETEDSPDDHTLTIIVDEWPLLCPGIDDLLGALDVKFCAWVSGATLNEVIGSVDWFDDSETKLGTTSLFHLSNVGGEDPHSIARADLPCIFAVSESTPPVKMVVQWNEVPGSSGGTVDSANKGNAPIGWRLSLWCCNQ